MAVAQGAPVTPIDKAGNIIGTQGSSVSQPEFNRNVGATTIATGQTLSSVSPAAAILVVAARAGRQSVVISNVTGTQPVYFTTTAATTGATTGFFLAGTVGATVTIATAASIYATSPTAAQTLSFLENY
jgi:hypothetical protein